MRRALLASDLDRTLIYSADALTVGDQPPPSLRTVEMYDERPASFMTEAAAALLSELSREQWLVPVTTRVPEQYARIALPGARPEYAVVANGGILLVDGDPDPHWSSRVATALASSAPLSEIWDHLEKVLDPVWTYKLRDAHGLFCYAVVDRTGLSTDFCAESAAWAADRGWRMSLQGRKLYWVPIGLTKSAAVQEIQRRTGAEIVLAAGDSLLDTDLLIAADRGIRPRHGELFDSGWSAEHVTVTEAAGVLAGEQIVQWFAAEVGSQQ